MHQGLSPYLVFYRVIKFEARLSQACSNSKSKIYLFYWSENPGDVLLSSLKVIYYKSLVQVGNKNFKICALSAFNNTEYEIYQDVVDM